MNEKLLLGLPIEFGDICFIYPPTYKDIALKGYQKYTELLNTLILSQEDLIDLFNENNRQFDTPAPSPLTFLVVKCSINPAYEDLVQKAFQFFTHQKILILYDSLEIIVGNPIDKKMLSEDNFLEFQNAIREACGVKLAERPDPHESQHVRYLKAKSRMRERVKAKQDGTHDDFGFQILLAAKSLGVAPQSLQDTPYAVGTKAIELQQKQDKYPTDMMCICAGADSKKIKPQYWMMPTKD